MLAAVLVQPKKDLELVELSIPELLPGQVLVKIAYSGVCHSQVMEADGLRGEDRFLPHLLGHEATGMVVSVGPEVSKVKVDDKVILGWIRGEGKDASGTKYRVAKSSASLPEGAVVNSGGVTTFSNYAVVAENRCVILPEGVPLDVGVLLGCALPTGAGIVMNEMRPAPGTSMGVLGLGGIGLSALLMAKALGCSPLIALDIEPAKLTLAKELGADLALPLPETLNVAEASALRQSVLDQGKAHGLNPVGFDFVVEASGQVRGIELGFSLVRPRGGLCVFASHPSAGEKIQVDPFEMIQGRRLQGSWGGACVSDRDIPKIAQKYREGLLPLEKLLTRPYKLNAINQALHDLRSRKIARALIDCMQV